MEVKFSEIMPNSKVRLNINVPTPVANKLNKLAQDSGYSKSDMLQKAVLLLEAVISAQEKGGRLVIVNEEEGIQKETNFIGI